MRLRVRPLSPQNPCMPARMPPVVLLAVILACAIAPVRAVEAPLSRASFDRAVKEGLSCKRIDKAAPYVIVKRGTEPFLATMLDDLFESTLGEEVSDSFVTVRLAPPYTRVRQAACEAKQFGEAFDAEAAWESARASATVTLTIETKTFSEPTLPMTVDMQDKYGTEPVTWQQFAGPLPVALTVRRGEGNGATVVPPVKELGLEYEFPASALQGAGPLFLLIQTEKDGPMTLKLRPSALRKP